MDWFYGLSDFCWLGRSCSPNWTAWAAIGGWLAAFATFLAVYVPARNYRREMERRQRLERSTALLVLNKTFMRVWDAAAQYNALRRMGVRIPARVASHGVGDGKLFRLKFVLLDIPVIEDVEEVILALTSLEAHIANWNETVEDHVGFGPAPSEPLADPATVQELLDNIKAAFERVETAANLIEGVDVPPLPVN